MNKFQQPPEVTDLIARLQSPDGSLRQEARTRLVEIGPSAAPALVKALQESGYWGRWEAAVALSEVQSPLSAPALVAALEDNNSGVGWRAADGLIRIGRAALPPLLEALTQRAGSTRLREGAHHVLHGMRALGLLRKPELAVYQALRDPAPDIEVPWAAEAALMAMAEKRAVSQPTPSPHRHSEAQRGGTE
jgi:HEAT repeat protein